MTLRRLSLLCLTFVAGTGCDPDPSTGTGAGDGATTGADGSGGTSSSGGGVGSGGEAGGTGGGEGEAGDDGQLPDPEGMRRIMLSVAATSPVGAFLPDATVAWAYVDLADGTPRVGGDTIEEVRLDGAGGAATSVALVADSAGGIHAVWDPSGQIAYAYRAPDGGWTSPEILAEDGAREGTIALSPGGLPIIAYARDLSEAVYPPTEIAVRKARAPDGDFGPADLVSEGCCAEGEFYGVEFSGPSLSVAPDGSTHVLFEWGEEYSASIEYVHDRSGTFQRERIVNGALFVPCPAIVADNTGASITYLPQENDRVLYVRAADGRVSEAEVVHEAEAVTLALLVPRAEGLDVVASVQFEDGTGEIVVVPLAGGDAEGLFAPGSAPALTPMAGGTFVSDGRLGFAVVHDGTVAELIVDARVGT